MIVSSLGNNVNTRNDNRNNSGRACRQPSISRFNRIVRRHVQLNQMRQRVHDSFLMVQTLNLRTAMHVPSEFINKQIVGFDGNRACPHNVSLIMRLSYQMCPSYYVMEYDNFRIPETMVQAKCQCTTCLSLNHNTSDQNSDIRRSCQPIYYYDRVLRVIGCYRGVYRYGDVWERISVGCQCVTSLIEPAHDDNMYTGFERTRS